VKKKRKKKPKKDTLSPIVGIKTLVFAKRYSKIIKAKVLDNHMQRGMTKIMLITKKLKREINYLLIDN